MPYEATIALVFTFIQEMRVCTACDLQPILVFFHKPGTDILFSFLQPICIYWIIISHQNELVEEFSCYSILAIFLSSYSEIIKC